MRFAQAMLNRCRSDMTSAGTTTIQSFFMLALLQHEDGQDHRTSRGTKSLCGTMNYPGLALHGESADISLSNQSRNCPTGRWWLLDFGATR